MRFRGLPGFCAHMGRTLTPILIGFAPAGGYTSLWRCKADGIWMQLRYNCAVSCCKRPKRRDMDADVCKTERKAPGKAWGISAVCGAGFGAVRPGAGPIEAQKRDRGAPCSRSHSPGSPKHAAKRHRHGAGAGSRDAHSGQRESQHRRRRLGACDGLCGKIGRLPCQRHRACRAAGGDALAG